MFFATCRSALRYADRSSHAQLSYEPLVTPLVAQMLAYKAALPSWVVIDGLEVFGEMALEAFELMTGRPTPKRLMKDVCRRTWERQRTDRPSLHTPQQ